MRVRRVPGVKQAVTHFVLLVVSMAPAGGCGGGDTGDENCWESGEDAYWAMSDLICQTGCGDDVVDGEACTEEHATLLEAARSTWCFDGCKVDRCLDAHHSYLSSCSESEREQYEYYCEDEGPFFDGSDPQRPCADDVRGW